jgi:hypothetical protein
MVVEDEGKVSYGGGDGGYVREEKEERNCLFYFVIFVEKMIGA